MRKKTTIALICLLCMALTTPVFAYNYEFTSGANTKDTFGKATSTNEPVASDPMSENMRRNKDAAHLPPPYFYGSGDIPTDASSPYHDNAIGTTTGYSSNTSDGHINRTTGFETSTSTITTNTAPQYYADGSVGTIHVARTGKTIKVFEGESLDNLKKGAGHFTSTSAWDGNVGLCGHNRGSSPYFSFVKDLRNGDQIVYKTKYGSRTYEVYHKEQIGEYDHSKLGWSADNILTLITCIADKPESRWVAQCREVK